MHARKNLDLLLDLLLQLCEAGIKWQVCGVFIEREDGYVARIEAEVDIGEVVEAVQEQACGGEKENREGDLADDQGT